MLQEENSEAVQTATGGSVTVSCGSSSRRGDYWKFSSRCAHRAGVAALVQQYEPALSHQDQMWSHSKIKRSGLVDRYECVSECSIVYASRGNKIWSALRRSPDPPPLSQEHILTKNHFNLILIPPKSCK